MYAPARVKRIVLHELMMHERPFTWDCGCISIALRYGLGMLFPREESMLTTDAVIELHVAPTGHDAADGTPKCPLATPEGARDRLRQMRRTAAPGQVTVWIHGGTYRLSRSLLLEGQDSGTEAAPVIWRACPGEEVRLGGGCSVNGSQFRPVSDPEILNRFDASVRSRLLQLDLKACGIEDTGGRTPLGFAFGFVVSPGDLDVYHQDRPLPIARWPRNDYALTGAVADAGTPISDQGKPSGNVDGQPVIPRGATFAVDCAVLRRWSRPHDLSCFGMWARDWAPSTVPVRAMDVDHGTITLDAPTYGGCVEGRRYYVQNVLEVIAQPGDWAVDRKAGILYLYPPVPQSELVLTLSVLKDALIVLKNTRWNLFRDLVIECGRFTGIHLEGEHNTVAGCVLRNLGGRGVTIQGRNNRVQSCHIFQTGQGGIGLNGGDRRTLTAALNVADNCEIHNFNRVCKTYNPAVLFSGCGNVMRHNRIYNGPHNAILLWGNDHLIEYNEIAYMGLESDDAAAFYMGRNPSEQGNILRYNFFHHIGCPTGWGTSAIYPDDGSCGLTVFGNVFYRCGHDGQVCMGAVFNNGGKDHRIENNIFVDCRIAFGNMLMLKDQWVHFVRGDTPATRSMHKILYEDVDIRSDLYLSRYPWLKDLESNPSSNLVRHNLAVRCGVLVTPAEQQTIEDNWMTDDDPGFEDLSHLNFQLKSGSEVFRKIPGFESIPFSEIGLKRDEYRTVVPGTGGLDCRPEIMHMQDVQSPGERAEGRLALHVVNLSDHPVSGALSVWTTHPEVVEFKGATDREYTLAPGEVRDETVPFAATARPDLTLMIGVKDSGTTFSLPVPVRFHYRAVVNRLKHAGQPAARWNLPESVVAMPFYRNGRTMGELAPVMSGDTWVVRFRVSDVRAVPAQGTGGWNDPYCGLLVASDQAKSTAEVYQVVFFPHGPGNSGTVRYFIGPRELPGPATIRWTYKPEPTGWVVMAEIPLSVVNLNARTGTFRLEAMVNAVEQPDGKPVLTTLFGSKPARLELTTLADVRIVS